MKIIEKDVIVLGGGCSGLWLSYELSRLHYRTALIEHGLLGGFASQRNQGWLHSGALYAAVMREGKNDEGNDGLKDLAKECLKASHRLQQFSSRHCKRSINLKSECMFLYRDTEAARHAADTLNTCGLTPRIVTGGIERIEPVLENSPIRMALVTKDNPMDCHRILSAVARRAAYYGAEFVTSSIPLNELNVRRVGNFWSVRFDDIEYVSPVLILAVGPFITRMSVAQDLIKPHEIVIHRAVVGILHHRVSHRILVFRDRGTGLLNLSPFPGGTSLNLGLSDEEVPDVSERQESINLEPITAALTEYLPGLGKFPSVRAHFYYCHKIREKELAIGRSARRFFWKHDPANGLIYFYPGKFTTALTGVRELIGEVRSQLPRGEAHSAIAKLARRRMEKHVAISPYQDVPRFSIKSDNRRFISFVSQIM